jgi:hypothetical protein
MVSFRRRDDNSTGNESDPDHYSMMEKLVSEAALNLTTLRCGDEARTATSETIKPIIASVSRVCDLETKRSELRLKKDEREEAAEERAEAARLAEEQRAEAADLAEEQRAEEIRLRMEAEAAENARQKSEEAKTNSFAVSSYLEKVTLPSSAEYKKWLASPWRQYLGYVWSISVGFLKIYNDLSEEWGEGKHRRYFVYEAGVWLLFLLYDADRKVEASGLDWTDLLLWPFVCVFMTLFLVYSQWAMARDISSRPCYISDEQVKCKCICL